MKEIENAEMEKKEGKIKDDRRKIESEIKERKRDKYIPMKRK
jgi:hypothetical protein